MTVTIKKGSEILTEAPMNAGTYTVEVHTEAGKNYEAGSQTFSFEIKKAPLSVKAVDRNVTVGDAIPEYTVLYEGFAGTDTADVLNGSLQFTCEYAPDSAAGDYSILPSGLTSEITRSTLRMEHFMQSAGQTVDPMIPTIPAVPAAQRTRRQRTLERMFLTAALLKMTHREPGNAMKRAGGSNSRTAPIRQEKRPVIRTVKSWDGSERRKMVGFRF